MCSEPLNPLRFQFYSLFGCEFTEEQHGSGPVHYACEQGGSVLEIYPRKPGQASTSAVRLGFVVDDIDRIERAISAHRGVVLRKGRSAGHNQTLVIRDSEGHVVELTERTAGAA